MSEKRCYTVKEVQEILACSRPSVYELLKRNVFRSFIVGGKHIISKSSFDERRIIGGKEYEYSSS